MSVSTKTTKRAAKKYAGINTKKPKALPSTEQGYVLPAIKLRTVVTKQGIKDQCCFARSSTQQCRQ